MILIIDNYDSFTYNLVQKIGELGGELLVFRHDRITISEIEETAPTHIIISPGPRTPKESGISNGVIKYFADKIPILGVCLGHQCIAYAFGGEVVRASRLMHGKTSLIYHDGKSIYQGLSNPLVSARYHSLIVREDSLPAHFEISARSEQGELMGIRHREFKLEGIQFHPESFLTPEGSRLLQNFLGSS